MIQFGYGNSLLTALKILIEPLSRDNIIPLRAMMNFRSSSFAVSNFCFLISLAVFVIVDEYLMPATISNSRTLSIIATFASTFGVYVIVFQAVFLFYSRYFFRVLNPKLNFSGKWYQIMVIHGEENLMEAIRHGPCMIDSEVDQIQISGQNFKIDDESTISSIWQSTAISVTNRQLQVLYTSEGINRPDNLRTTRGTMLYQISGDPPTRLQGTFHDVVPAQNSGIITIYKSKSEYEQQLRSMQSSQKQS